MSSQQKKKSDRSAKKARRRVAQLEAMRVKAEAEMAYYKSQRNNGGAGGGRKKKKVNLEQLFGGDHGPRGIRFDEYDAIEVERSGEGAESIPAMESFKEMCVPSFVMKNIERMGYTTPTPIQKHAVPCGLQARDLMCCAQTGSGKTCAFLLPLVTALAAAKGRPQFKGISAAPVALILAPTRELALQINEEAQKITYGSHLVTTCVYGGAKARPQLASLAQGVDIVVATPGRLQDFVDRDIVSLEHVQFLVLDEADRMLDMGFEPQIRKLVQKSGMPRSRRTFMFSATFPKEMQRLAGDFQDNYVWIAVGRVGSTVDAIEQRVWLATNNKREKLALLYKALEDCPGERTLVFVKKKSDARWVAKQLRMDNEEQPARVTSAEIHGDRSQSQRESALEKFRDGKVQVLVATDVAARGLDISGIAHVINFHLATTPDEFDSYVHRIGRTGRAGKSGLATSFYVPGIEPKVGCGRVASKLIELLKESNQQVPEWLQNHPDARSGKRSKQAAKKAQKDVRKQQQPQQQKRRASPSPKGADKKKSKGRRRGRGGGGNRN